MAGDFYNMAEAITPSDTVNLRRPSDAVYVGGAGNLVVILQDGTAITFAVVAGEILPVRAYRINATNTTATGLVALNLV